MLAEENFWHIKYNKIIKNSTSFSGGTVYWLKISTWAAAIAMQDCYALYLVLLAHVFM